MGLRLYSEFHSSTNKLFKIEVYDNDYTAAATTFDVASDGFTLNYSGETDDIVSPIIGSNCTVSAYNNSTAFDSFITKLFRSQENRFFLRILLDSGAGYSHYWSGIIMQDLVTVEDASKPSVFNLVAVDGIGHLANLDYTFSAYETIEGFIERALGDLSLSELYISTDSFYSITLNTWETNHTYSLSTDVSTLIRFYAPNLQTREQDGTKVYPKYLEVLKELCTAFGARFYQKNGVYHFEQYYERVANPRQVHEYSFDGTYLGASSVSDDVTLDGTTGVGARLAGNQFNYLPGIKKVEVTHNKELRQNLLGRYVDFYTTTTALDLGVLSDDNDAYLKVQGNLIYRLVHPTTGSDTGYYRPRFRIQLKIEDSASPGTYYYLKRDWNPSGGNLYGATSWTTTASYYYLDASISQNSSTGLTVANLFTVVTPALPVTGEATIDIEQDGLYNQNNASVSVPSGYFASWSVEQVLISYLSTESNSVSTKYLSSNTDAKIKSNLVLDLGEVRTADAFGGPGSFFVYDGSSWVASGDWRRGNKGTYIDLLQLLTKEVLALHSKPIQRYSGTIVGPHSFGVRYIFDSAYWLTISGSYNANMDEWSAEWFSVEIDETVVSADNPIDDGNLGDFQGRTSSQQGTDEFINATQVTTDQVTGTTVKVAGGTGTQGDLTWSTDEDTIQLQMNGTTHFIGQDVVYNVKNQTGSTISKGTAVMATGTLGSSSRILVAPADASGDVPARFYLGISAEDITNGSDGKVVEFGKIRQIDTSAYTDGDVLWLDPVNDGQLTQTEPTAPAWKIATAYVIDADANGSIMVRANQGHKLEDAQDVNITSPANGDILRWDSTNGYWYNTPLPT